jgi:hypothetical protein
MPLRIAFGSAAPLIPFLKASITIGTQYNPDWGWGDRDIVTDENPCPGCCQCAETIATVAKPLVAERPVLALNAKPKVEVQALSRTARNYRRNDSIKDQMAIQMVYNSRKRRNR